MRLTFGIDDILSIMKRRFFLALITALCLAILFVAAIRLLPLEYESRAELIVEDQQVRNEYVASAVASDALARIQAVGARVMARDNLLDIAQEQGFFASRQISASDRAASMARRTRILVNRIQSDGGRSAASAITVELAFTANDPVVAQRMTNAILTDFVTRAVELRSDIAKDQTDFLAEEERKLARQLQDIQNKITTVEAENPGSLPDDRGRYERTLDLLTSERSRLQGDIDQVQSQISLLQIQRPAIVSDAAVADPRERELSLRRRELAALRRNYTDNFPDVTAALDEVLALEEELDGAAFRRTARREIARVGEALARASGAEAAVLQERREDLRARLAANNAAPASPTAALNVDAQIGALRSRLSGLRRQLANVDARVAEANSQLASLPAVERELIRLERERAEARDELGRMRNNRAEAARSQSLEQQAKAERLTPLVQPTRPDEPTSPNRLLLALAALAGAGGIGALAALIPEVFFPKVRLRSHLEELLPGVTVLDVPRFGGMALGKPQMMRVAALCAVSLVLIMILGVVGYQTVV